MRERSEIAMHSNTVTLALPHIYCIYCASVLVDHCTGFFFLVQQQFSFPISDQINIIQRICNLSIYLSPSVRCVFLTL